MNPEENPVEEENNEDLEANSPAQVSQGINNKIRTCDYVSLDTGGK